LDELFGDTLRDPNVRFELEIALRARALLRNQKARPRWGAIAAVPGGPTSTGLANGKPPALRAARGPS
jgi:hypothetical protein